MIKAIKLVGDKWRIMYLCGCGKLASASIKKHQKEIALDQIMRGIFQCGYCKKR
jgi:hypothetical protein